MSFSFPLLDQLRRRSAPRLLQSLALAMVGHGAAFGVLAIWPHQSPGSAQRPRRVLDTPQLLRLSRQLQSNAPAPLAVELSVDALSLPPPSPPDGSAGPLSVPVPVPVQSAAAAPAAVAEPWPQASADEVIAGSVAWLPAQREGFDPAAPLQQGIRRRQRWLSSTQAQGIDQLWDRSASAESVAPPSAQATAIDWRAVASPLLNRLGFSGDLHGVSLVYGSQVTLIWRERGRWWLIRRREQG